MLLKEVRLLKECLQQQGHQVQLLVDENTNLVEIKWKKQALEYYVYSTDIVYHKGRLAWFQASAQNSYRLCIKYKEDFWEWKPELYNPVFGCLCMALQWVQDHLIFVYQEKHDIYIVSVKDKKLKLNHFNGAKFKLTATHFTYQTYQQESRDLVGVLEIPSLKPLEEIELRAAKQLDLVPQLFL
jgi:hypothetical protein